MQALLSGREERLQVWDLCTLPSVRAAQQWRREAATAAAAAGAGGAQAFTPGDAAAFLAAAVNCSSGAHRQTPLHVAAEEGDQARAAALLGLGAALDAKDRSGASPLFAACEAGSAAALGALLAAGADATLRNTAGEAPLYIAALRGHDDVVAALLAHCAAAGVAWQDPRLYGDGWTPLMAAAVGGRAAIAARLLRAAGGGAQALVRAVNRYGQTAVHIAARKGSPLLLRSLVDAGGGAELCAIADCDGKTAAEVAARNGNGQAWRLLAEAGSARAEAARQRGTLPTAERPRGGDAGRQHGRERWVGRRLQQRKAREAH